MDHGSNHDGSTHRRRGVVVLSHRDARAIVSEAFHRVFSREPTRPEAQCLQAVGWLETGYGQHWRGAGSGSNNWGAIQAHAGWTGDTFDYTDTRPNDDGTSTPYRQAFRKYASPADGATDLAKTVYTGGRNPLLGATAKLHDPLGSRHAIVLPAATKGDTHGFSAGLYFSVYYQGFGRNAEERIAHHQKAVDNACAAMARELGEPMPDGSEPPRVIRTLRVGADDATLPGSPVATMQGIVGAKVDGVFGSATAEAVKAWQRKHNLKPDGVFGPVCYHVVETEFDGGTIDALYGYET